MSPRLREQLTIVNAFVHDVATGTWISCLVLVALLERKARSGAWASASGLVHGLAHEIMFLTWGSLAVIVATGVVRMLTFKLFGWTGDVAADRVRLLKVKHAVLGTAFLLGTAWQAYVVYR